MRELIIADNQGITALGIKYLTQSIKDLGPVYDIATKRALLSLIPSCPEALILLDYTLFDFQRADELLITQERYPKTNWIMFSDELSIDLLAQLVFNSQSFSVVLKSDGIDEINMALAYAKKGERYICNQVSNQLLNRNHSQKNKQEHVLTNAEKEILKEIASGKTTKEIAAARHLSVHTVITHRKNIFRKIEVNNIYEATKYAVKAGIIDLMEYYI